MGVQDLVEAWHELLSRHTASVRADETGRALLACWADPHRRYHDLGHLRGVLGNVDELASYAADADAVRLAAWYHDAVYAGPTTRSRAPARPRPISRRWGSVPIWSPRWPGWYE